MIHDQFTYLNGKVSRQRIYQLRKDFRFQCIICGKRAGKARLFCDKHYIQRNDLKQPFKNINRRPEEKIEWQTEEQHITQIEKFAISMFLLSLPDQKRKQEETSKTRNATLCSERR